MAKELIPHSGALSENAPVLRGSVRHARQLAPSTLYPDALNRRRNIAKRIFEDLGHLVVGPDPKTWGDDAEPGSAQQAGWEYIGPIAARLNENGRYVMRPEDAVVEKLFNAPSRLLSEDEHTALGRIDYLRDEATQKTYNPLGGRYVATTIAPPLDEATGAMLPEVPFAEEGASPYATEGYVYTAGFYGLRISTLIDNPPQP